MVAKSAIIAIVIAAIGAAIAAGVGAYFLVYHHHAPRSLITVSKTAQIQKGQTTQKKVTRTTTTTQQQHRTQRYRVTRRVMYGKLLSMFGMRYENATAQDVKLFNETLNLFLGLDKLKEFTIYIPAIKLILSGYGTSMRYVLTNIEIGIDKVHNMTYVRTIVPTYSAKESIEMCAKILPNGTYRTCMVITTEMNNRKVTRRMCNITTPIASYGHRLRMIKFVTKLLHELSDVRYYVVVLNSTRFICKCGLRNVGNFTSLYKIPTLPSYTGIGNVTLCLCLHPGETAPSVIIIDLRSNGVRVSVLMYISRIVPYFNYEACKSILG